MQPPQQHQPPQRHQQQHQPPQGHQPRPQPSPWPPQQQQTPPPPRKSPVLLIVLAIGAGVAVLAVGVVILVNVLNQRAPAPPNPSIALPGQSQEQAGGEELTPAAKQRKDFLFTLATIAPWLLDEEINWSAATRTCTDIKGGKGDEQVLKAAQERFTGVDAEQARKIVDEIRVWCKP